MWDITITPSWNLAFSLLAVDPHGITLFLASQQVHVGDPHWLMHAPSISGWVIALIPFVTTHPNDLILSAFCSLKPDFPRGHPS
jgi:hypothetical protein